MLRNYRPRARAEGLHAHRSASRSSTSRAADRSAAFGTPADGNRKSDEWLVLFVAGMWFQDLWNYDFRRTEMCIIPYGTQMGEISFCAYNTGVGWRHIVEKMYQNATVAEWYAKHGKHAVYANPAEGGTARAARPAGLAAASRKTACWCPWNSARNAPTRVRPPDRAEAEPWPLDQPAIAAP